MRRVFFSFHYGNDNWRVQMIKQMGKVESQVPVYSNKWEEVRLKKDSQIKEWIDENIKGCSCLVVLIGEETATRKYVLYEIEKAWNEGKGVLGIYIHNLKDKNGCCSKKGDNPFELFEFNVFTFMNLKVPVHSYNCLKSTVDFSRPNKEESQRWYEQIKEYLTDWVEEAIKYRKSCNYKIKRKVYSEQR